MTSQQRSGRRIQLSRRRGWGLASGARSVAYPSKYANPYRPIYRTPAANRAAVAQYRVYLAEHPDVIAALTNVMPPNHAGGDQERYPMSP